MTDHVSRRTLLTALPTVALPFSSAASEVWSNPLGSTAVLFQDFIDALDACNALAHQEQPDDDETTAWGIAMKEAHARLDVIEDEVRSAPIITAFDMAVKVAVDTYFGVFDADHSVIQACEFLGMSRRMVRAEDRSSRGGA